MEINVGLGDWFESYSFIKKLIISAKHYLFIYLFIL